MRAPELPRHNRLARRVRAGEPAFGLFCSLPSPAVVEMIGRAGYDFAVLDTEHTLVCAHELGHLLRAAESAGLDALVRVPADDAGAIGRVLDAGAAGVVVPRVRSGAGARAAVRAARHHPLGERGLDAGRAAGFGDVDLAELVRRADEEVLVAVMVEDRDGVEAIDEIVAVPGLDLVVEGAADLSHSLGVPWETSHPRVREALHAVEGACRRNGVGFCAIPRVPGDLDAGWDRGVRTFVLGEARSLAFRALRAPLTGPGQRRRG